MTVYKPGYRNLRIIKLCAIVFLFTVRCSHLKRTGRKSKNTLCIAYLIVILYAAAVRVNYIVRKNAVSCAALAEICYSGCGNNYKGVSVKYVIGNINFGIRKRCSVISLTVAIRNYGYGTWVYRKSSLYVVYQIITLYTVTLAILYVTVCNTVRYSAYVNYARRGKHLIYVRINKSLNSHARIRNSSSVVYFNVAWCCNRNRTCNHGKNTRNLVYAIKSSNVLT